MLNGNSLAKYFRRKLTMRSNVSSELQAKSKVIFTNSCLSAPPIIDCILFLFFRQNATPSAWLLFLFPGDITLAVAMSIYTWVTGDDGKDTV